MKFIDIHSHLELCEPLEEVIRKSKEKGVVLMLSCGINKETNRKTLDIAKKYPEIRACLGVFPANGLKMTEKEIDREIQFIKDYKDKIIAIGECGLDLHECKNLERQKEILKKFVSLAKELDKPIIIHSRKVELETIEFLETLHYRKILMHCFSGSKKLVQRIINNGWFLSVPASCTYNEQFQELIQLTPLEQLFGETDAPFLHPNRERDNIHGNVVESYKKIAEIKRMSLDHVKEQIYKNYEKLF